MTQQFLEWLRGLILAGNTHPFYLTAEWIKLSFEVRSMDRFECQLCKARGRYSKADLVHHVNHVNRRPELALDIFFLNADGERKRNLVSVCRWCHENVCHPERLRRVERKPVFETEERWD
ncbi:MAG: HNH endonuclease [Oscillospiraceae bacterium]|nr:HNH endonuclease [Oscillospiraceae bacterium]